MKYINDLAYLSHIAQTEQLVKDRKQKNKYRQTELFNYDDSVDERPVNKNSVDETCESIEPFPVIEEESNRRAGNDRRKTKQERGRYVESRQKKNRRYQKELRIII